MNSEKVKFINSMFSIDEKTSQLEQELEGLREKHGEICGKIAELRQLSEADIIAPPEADVQEDSDGHGDMWETMCMLCLLAAAATLLLISLGYFIPNIGLFDKGIAVAFTTAGLLTVLLVMGIVRLIAHLLSKKNGGKKNSASDTAAVNEKSNTVGDEIAALRYKADMLDERITETEHSIASLQAEFKSSIAERDAILLAQKLILETAEDATSEFLPKIAP